jgi:hypothetical protein
MRLLSYSPNSFLIGLGVHLSILCFTKRYEYHRRGRYIGRPPHYHFAWNFFLLFLIRLQGR